MDRADFRNAIIRAVPLPEPRPAVIVPEGDLARLTLAARETVFAVEPPTVEVVELDVASEPFVDMLDLPHAKATAVRAALRDAGNRVRMWIDAGCITLPPVKDIRALVEAIG